MKILGVVFILCGSLSFGANLCREQSRRLQLLRELQNALEQLQGELELRSPPLPDLFTSLAARSQGETCAFLRGVVESMENLGEQSFAALWEAQIRRFLPILSPLEQDELIRLGSVLGHLDLEAELRALSDCRVFLRGELDRQLEQFPNRRRLILSLSAAAGILAVILMI